MMRSHGLALGGAWMNAIVMDDYKMLNSMACVYDDEFAKHKILDAMGDLYVVGKCWSRTARSARAMRSIPVRLREPLAHPDALRSRHLDDEKKAPVFRPAGPGLGNGPPCCCSAGP